MVKGKAKGNSFENKIYDTLREHNIFIRKNKGSGNAADNKGDLETKDFLIECKHHKKVSEFQLEDWKKKILEEAVPLNKIAVLIVKENYKDIRVILIYTGTVDTITISLEEFISMIKELELIK